MVHARLLASPGWRLGFLRTGQYEGELQLELQLSIAMSFRSCDYFVSSAPRATTDRAASAQRWELPPAKRAATTPSGRFAAIMRDLASRSADNRD